MFRIVGVGAAALVAFAIMGSSAAADSGVIGQWHFDEGSGTVAHDSSGNNNTGTLIANPGHAVPAWVLGRFGTALSFNGSDGVQVPDSDTPGSMLDSATSAVSVMAWVKSSGDASPGDYKYIIAKGANGCDSASYGLYTGAAGGLSFYISNSQASATADYSLSPDAGGGVWDGTWHQVVGTFDGGTLRLYVDGVQIGDSGTSFPGPIDYARSTSTDLYLGYYPAPPGCLASGFTGTIDEPTLWNFALSAAQVSQLYAPAPLTGSSPPGSAPSTPTQPSPTGTGTGTGHGTNHSKAPALSRLRVSPSTLAVTAKHAKGKPAPGMTISYSDTQAAVSSFSVQLPESGVVKRGRCVAPPRGKIAKRVKRCTRYRVLGRFAHTDRAGTNRFAFTAVRVLQLAPHGYLLVATPSAHRQTGKTVSAKFTIKR